MEKSVFVAFIGRPNVGKSSLINELFNSNMLIVSRKPQTTRNRIALIKTLNNHQFVFYDTPGIFKAKNVLGKKMTNSINYAISDVDCAVFVVEPKNLKSNFFIEEKKLIEKLRYVNIPTILAINKIDLIKNKVDLIPIVKKYNDLFKFSATVFVSAKLKQGFDILLSEIEKHEVECNHFFPEEMKTDKSNEFFISEIFRQKLLLNLNKEIPHYITVEVEKIKKLKFGLTISVIIYCTKKNHKGIVIGKNGLLLKKIATESRMAMEEFFDCSVNLKCWVKVKEKWENNEKFLNYLGF